MSPIVIGLIAGVAVSLGMVLMRKRTARVAPDIVGLLRATGPSTVAEIMAALGMKGLSKQGYVISALADLQRDGKIQELAPPPETPRLQRFKATKWAAV